MSLSRQRKLYQMKTAIAGGFVRTAREYSFCMKRTYLAEGNATKTGLAEFLVNNTGAPEHQALLTMIGDLTGILS
jgi:hypothetical protein